MLSCLLFRQVSLLMHDRMKGDRWERKARIYRERKAREKRKKRGSRKKTGKGKMGIGERDRERVPHKCHGGLSVSLRENWALHSTNKNKLGGVLCVTRLCLA